MLRKILLLLVALVAAGLAIFWWTTRPLPILTVTSWAGAYGRAQAVAQMRPYAAARHVDVHLAQWDGELPGLKGDVVDFELPGAVDACDRGLLEKIDATDLPPGTDGTPAQKDFVPGAVGPCWIGSIVYSQIILYTPHAFPAAPTRLTDFFDTAKFPGKRALKRGSGKYNLEMALLADGVAPRDVYSILSTSAGLARALHKLDSLGASRIWYAADSEASALIKSGGAAFATALNGQLYDAAQKDGAAPGVIWDRQLYEFDAFAIPLGNPNKTLALDCIRFATGTQALAGVADWVPYGPARRSALVMVGKNPELGTPMQPFMPTAHFDTAFAVDDAWWHANGARIDVVWRKWLADSAH
jgi:putative spermidine/putrescine transport system substrate-binding protein